MELGSHVEVLRKSSKVAFGKIIEKFDNGSFLVEYREGGAMHANRGIFEKKDLILMTFDEFGIKYNS